MQKVPANIIAAVGYGPEISGPKFQAQHIFIARVNEARGHLAMTDIDALLSAGYTEVNILHVILGTGLKTLSSYTCHISEPPLDAPFQADTQTRTHSAVVATARAKAVSKLQQTGRKQA